MMKKLMITVVMACFAPLLAYAQAVQDFEDRPKISVQGEALVRVAPDKILIHLGIETRDSEMQSAKENNREILEKALAAMKDLGVADQGIRTDHLSIEPRWKNHYEREEFLGFFVRNSLTVTLEDPAKVESLVGAVLEAGVNYIHGIDFQTTEFKRHREQARMLALEAAKEKAEKMAAVLERSIGPPLKISEGYLGSPRFYWSGWSSWRYGHQQSLSQNVVSNVPGGSDLDGGIALGQISIRASVSVTFELSD